VRIRILREMPRHTDEDEFDETAEAEDAQETALETFCPDCRAPIHATADICPKCGMWVDGEALRGGKSGVRTNMLLRVVVVLLLILALTLPFLRYL